MNQLLKTLSETDFNLKAAAEALHMEPHSLHYRMHQLKIEVDQE